MSAKQKIIPIAKSEEVFSNNGKSVDLLDKRASPEVVIAFMGAVGCGLPRVITECEKQLEKLGYKVERIKLSVFINAQIKNNYS